MIKSMKTESKTGKNGPTILVALVLLLSLAGSLDAQSGFTQQDRDLLVELRTRMLDIDKRFEQIDKRFAELREDMNKRFEQVDRRFEQIDKRFEQITSFFWMIAAIFAGMTAAVIGFALWDRRTMIRPFETRVSDLDKKIKINSEQYESLVATLKEYAQKNKDFSQVIQRFHLF